MAWIWPSTCKTISQPYGRKNARYVKGYHTGIDIACPNGSPIRAVADGTVTFAGWNGVYGNQVKQRVGAAEVWYNHLSVIKVQKGDGVTGGSIIGNEGTTGQSTGPHLHLEVRIDGRDVDPMPYLGGSKVVPASSTAQQVSLNPLEGLKNVKEFFELLTNPVTWLRVGMFVGGGVLILMAVVGLAKAKALGKNVGKVVNNNA
jgi:murein DD-endopeptidase MepM/ murein hydrolase activator NlpD